MEFISKSFDCEYVIGSFSGKGCNLSSDEIRSICKSDLEKIYENENMSDSEQSQNQLELKQKNKDVEKNKNMTDQKTYKNKIK